MKSEQRAREFAESIGARIVFPTEPRRPVSIYEKTDVRRTWARFVPEPDFITGIPMIERRDAFANAPESWRMA